MSTLSIFAARFKELRESAGLKQAEIGEKLGVSRGAISFYENCDRTPDIEFAVKVATFFNVSTDWLLGLSEYKDMTYRGLTAEDMGLSEQATTVLSTYQRLGAQQLLRTVNSLLEAESLTHGHTLLQIVAAYLYFGKEVECIYKIAENGDIVVKSQSDGATQNNATNDYLTDLFCGTLLTIDDQTLFDEALYNLACQSLRSFKAKLRNKAEKGESENGKSQDND